MLAGGLYGAVVPVLAGFLTRDLTIAGAALDQWWLAGLVAVAAVASPVAARSSWAPAVRARLLEAGAAPPGSPGSWRLGPATPVPAFAERAAAPAMEVSAA